MNASMPEGLMAGHAFRELVRAKLAPEPPERVFDPSKRPARGDHDLNADNDLSELAASPRAAAVLVPVVAHRAGLTVLLTLRSENLLSHGGQIAFPGGKMDPDDDTPLDTALRETREEVGLEASYIEPVGYLDSYQTGTGFRIVPVVGIVRPGFELRLDPSEVAETFEVPLAFLMDRANHQHHSTEWQGAIRCFYAMPYKTRYIWGATAGILRNMQETLFEA